MLSRLRSFVATWTRRERFEDGLDEELRFHLDAYTEDLIRAGVPQAEAARRARIDFGSLEATKDDCRQARGLRFLDDLRIGFGTGLRTLRKSPRVAFLAILCLSVGIGVNVMVFRVVNGILLQPLPLGVSDRLVVVNEVRHGDPSNERLASYPNFRDWQQRIAAAADLAGMRSGIVTVVDQGRTDRYPAGFVTRGFFPLLDLQPTIGRWLSESDDVGGAAPVVVLSDRLWEDRYGSDPAVIGLSILVDGTPRTVVGVMPSFTHPGLPRPWRAQLWLPLTPVAHDDRRNQRTVVVYAKPRAGVEPDHLRAQLTVIAHALEIEHLEDHGWGISVRPFTQSVSPRIRSQLMLAMGAAAFVLLIACGNVTNLMLARAMQRRKEIGVRIALGASHGRIVRLLLMESALVGVASIPLGFLLASWGIDLLVWAMGEQAAGLWLPIDGRVLLFATGTAVLTSLLAGLVPAFHAVRGGGQVAVRGDGWGSTERPSGKRLRGSLVVAEVALSMVLLVGALLFTQSFVNLLHADGGIDTASLLTMRFDLPDDSDVVPDARARRIDEIVARLEALPSVESVAASNLMPLLGGGASTAIVGDTAPAEDAPTVLYGGVTSRYFETLDVPLLHGRVFTTTEARTRSAVAIVNRSMAERLWPSENPLGRRFRLADDADGLWHTVTGVSRDIPNWNLSDRPIPTAYLPYRHTAARTLTLLIRATGDPALIARPALETLGSVDRELPVFGVMPMDEVHRRAFRRQEVLAATFLAFGVIAALLAATGLYGVVSYSVVQRTREIGLRLALGARRQDVLRLVIRQAMMVILAGIALGLAGAFAVTRVARRHLYEVSATDPIGFAGAVVLLVAVGWCASYAPARRAAAVDPMVAMRE